MWPLRILQFSLFLFAVSFTLFATQSGDALMYLNLARDFVFADGWPTIDPYVYSLTQAPLIWTHEYLSFAIFDFAYQSFGIAGLIFLKSMTWTAIFAIALWSRPREHNTSWLWMGLFILAVMAGSFRFIERTSMFSDLILVALCAYLPNRKSIDRKMIIVLAAVFLVWAQLHPAFPLGLALIAIWAVHRTWVVRTNPVKRLPWLLVPTMILMIHPDGPDGLFYPIRFAFLEASVFKKYNYEWLPSYHVLFRFAPETIAFWVLAAISLALIIRHHLWRDLNGLFALFAIATALQAVRFIPWASFALLICLKSHIQWTSPPLIARRWGAAIASALLLTIATKNLIWGYNSSSGERLAQFTLDPKFFPEKTVDFLLKTPIAGRLYNSHDFGSYLIWRGYGPIFHHGFMTDMEFYENDVMGVFRSQARFLELAAKYNWTMLLIEKNANFRYFYQILGPLPEWKVVAEDDASFLIYRLPN